MKRENIIIERFKKKLNKILGETFFSWHLDELIYNFEYYGYIDRAEKCIKYPRDVYGRRRVMAGHIKLIINGEPHKVHFNHRNDLWGVGI